MCILVYIDSSALRRLYIISSGPVQSCVSLSFISRALRNIDKVDIVDKHN